MAWNRKPQEREDRQYLFAGRLLLSRNVYEKVHFSDIVNIYQDLQAFVQQQNGIDYLQVYTDEQGRQLHAIDMLDKSMLEDASYPAEQNYCMLLFADEYKRW